MSVRNVFTLDHIFAIRIIRVVYVIGLIVIVLGGVLAMVGSLSMASDSGGTAVLGAVGAIVGMLLGLLLWRLICELWMVTFGIYERLGGRY
jgi:hypothetical protein